MSQSKREATFTSLGLRNISHDTMDGQPFPRYTKKPRRLIPTSCAAMSRIHSWLVTYRKGNLPLTASFMIVTSIPRASPKISLPPLRSLTRALLERFENYLSSKTDAVITVNSRLAKRFERFNESVIVLPNYPRLDVSSRVHRKREILSSDEARLI